ncbi:hypothetical protein [Sphingobacterium sp. SYP-B4668]|uniref:hypothetical protein n=1 Tax=Sphingobacterium sp. SYP-B4668 TaxID=2996035 RepID=UPI0022DD439B|nr:hypothetical protein [Sphingobacterium sp. SYP-B4668]
MQKFQDWFTQQWVILWGKKIDPEDTNWLMGPLGNLNGIGENFINELAEKEMLIIKRGTKSQGLIESIDAFQLPESKLARLSKNVVDFYTNTSDYDLDFSIKWNPFFRVFGIMVTKLFSNRIKQLNIPTKNIKQTESLTNEILTLIEPNTNRIKYTAWYRTIKKNGKVVYSGIYGTCILPSGETCLKAIFPLPKGNATVIMSIDINLKGELILNSSGKKFGDAGFYFLLNDSKGNYWTQYIRSFQDRLIISQQDNHLLAEQRLTLWKLMVLRLRYEIKKKQ